MAIELKEFFPDENLSGLVVRRRKTSSASIDIDELPIMESVSTRRRIGSSFDCSLEDLDHADEVVSRSFRKRTFTQGSSY